MAFVIADRVRETSTSTGTGNFTLGGAVTGYQTFASVLSTADTTYYTIADLGGANWEVGIGTFTSPSTLARTTILSSSNGGSVVTFTSGTKEVFISLPASKTNVEDQPNLIEVNSSSDALRITQTGTGNALVVEDSANPDSSPFVVDASGNVGIGTSTPTAPLDVNGNVAITGAARRITGDMSNATLTNRLMFQTSTANSTTALGILPNGSGQQGQVNLFGGSDPANTSLLAMLCSTAVSEARLASSITGTGTYLPMTFYTGGSERMRVDSSGNVGIGTSSPGTYKTAIITSGTSNFSGVLISGAAGANDAAGLLRVITGNTTQTNYPVIVGNSAATLFAIDGSGNVGIGTSSPATKLHLLTPSATAVALRAGNSVSYAEFQVDASGNSQLIAPGGTQIFNTNGAERMRINSSGNVGIGTSSPTQTLTVNGSMNASNFYMQDSSATAAGTYGFANSNGPFLQTWGNSTVNAGALIISTSGSERMRIDSSGNLSFNSGYGSAAVAYGCRAWVKFNGTGTLAINGSGNVSSVTDHGTGDYTVNFSTSMPDANYSTYALGDGPVNGQHCQPYVAYAGVRSTYSTSGVAVAWFNATNSGDRADPAIACVSIFR